MKILNACFLLLLVLPVKTKAYKETEPLDENGTDISNARRLQCHGGTKMRSNLLNEDKEGVEICDEGSVCANIEAYVSAGPVRGRGVLGQCTPRNKCDDALCSKARAEVTAFSGARMERCIPHCCEENLCNTITFRENLVQESTLNFDESVQIRCYDGMHSSSENGVENRQNVTLCQRGLVCAHAFTFSATFVTGLGLFNFGLCMAPGDCDTITCEKMLRNFIGESSRNIPNCAAACCSKSLCNKPIGLQSKAESSTTTPTTPARQVRRVTLYQLWTRAFGIEDDIPFLIPSWHEYVYDGSYPFNQIKYGGRFMYYNGNKVRFYKGTQEPSFIRTTPLTYNQDYNYGDYDLKLGGRNHPFMALAWIKNPARARQTYSFQVRGSSGSDSGSQFESVSGTLSDIPISSLQYHYFQIHGDNEPSICEVYFLLSSEIWSSVIRSTFRILHFSSSRNMDNSVRLQGRPYNVLMGYVLLSKTNGQQITKYEVERFIGRMARYVLQVPVEQFTTTPLPEPTTVPTSPCGTFPNATLEPQAFNSPGAPGNYPNSLDCTWIIYGRTDYFIEINFESFVTESCCDYLDILESKYSVRRMQGTVDSSSAAATFVSSADFVRMQFISDRSLSHKGFRATYKLTPIEPETTPAPETTLPPAPCGFVATATAQRQEINSPGWPNEYSSNLHCIWRLSTSTPGNRIQIDFRTFKTEVCCDYLTIAENLGQEARELRGRLSSRDSIFTSQTDSITLTFRSDSSVVEDGFQASFQEVGEIASTVQPPTIPTTAPPGHCGVFPSATRRDQIFSSPGFPNSTYDNNLNCEWEFTARTRGHRIRIDLRSFDSEYCCDYLIFEENGSEVKRMRGNMPSPETFISSSGSLTLKFHSDGSINRQGFYGTYSETNEVITTTTPQTSTTAFPCGFIATASSAPKSLNSPSWPGNYHNSEDCEWRISATSPSNRVYIRFISFETETCCDYLKILENGIEKRRLKGTSSNFEPYNSTASTVVLRFISDVSVVFQGFEASFQEIVVPMTSAAKTMTTTAANLPSEVSLETIQTTRAKETTVVLPECECLSGNYGCRRGLGTPCQCINERWLCDGERDCPDGDDEVNCIRTTAGPNIVLKGATSPLTPPSYKPAENCVLGHIDFGFNLTEGVCVCAEDHFACEQNGNAKTCTCYPQQWLCDGDADCSKGYDERNCSDCDCRPEEFACGEIPGYSCRCINPTWVCDGDTDCPDGSDEQECRNQTTAGPVTFPPSCGFDAEAEITPKSLVSPEFPSLYPSFANCQWKISANHPEDKIMIDFKSFWTEECCDILEIRENSAIARWVKGYISKPEPFYSSTNQVLLTFVSDRAVTYNGFNATYQLIPSVHTTPIPTSATPEVIPIQCGFSIIAENHTQTITSPGWPGHYLHSQDCQWAITTLSPDDHIRIRFSNFWTEECCDYLSMSENGAEIERLQGYYENAPYDLVSLTNQINLTFHSDSGISFSGFQATVQLGGIAFDENARTIAPCGFSSSSSNTSQPLNSPGWPGRYRNSLSCEWSISSGNPRHRMRIDFIVFLTEHCCDTLKIYENGEEKRQVAGLLENISPYVSTGDSVTLKFTSDSRVTYGGFQLTYQDYVSEPTTVQPTTTSTTTVSSTSERSLGKRPNYFSSVSTLSSLNCRVTAGTDLSVHHDHQQLLEDHMLKFQDVTRKIFSISSPPSSARSPKVFTIHRGKSPCGFRANATDQLQTLNSVQWPQLYPNKAHCSWVITAPLPGDRIRINFISFITEECCDFLKIYESGREYRSMAGFQYPPSTYSSATNHVTLVFSSDNAVVHAGFQATFALEDPAIEVPLTTAAPIREDEDFLPSCTIRQAISSIFRCEYVFAKPRGYESPKTCRVQIDEAIECVGNQLALCQLGGTNSKLDSFQLPSLNSKGLIEFLYYLTIRSSGLDSNRYIGMFCTHAHRNESYPDPVLNYYGFCKRGVTNQMLDRAKDFYYSFIHATSKSDICRAFRTLKRWFLKVTSEQCNYNALLPDTIDINARRYIARALKIALEAAEELDSISCSVESVETCWYGFGVDCPKQPINRGDKLEEP